MLKEEKTYTHSSRIYSNGSSCRERIFSWKSIWNSKRMGTYRRIQTSSAKQKYVEIEWRLSWCKLRTVPLALLKTTGRIRIIIVNRSQIEIVINNEYIEKLIWNILILRTGKPVFFLFIKKAVNARWNK